MRIIFVGNFSVPFSSENHHANTLQSMGHKVVRLQERRYSSDHIMSFAQSSDMLIWVHTHGWETRGRLSIAQVFAKLKNMGIPTLTYHLDLWLGIAREKDLDNDEFYHSIEYFFTVDKLMADWFNDNTEVKGRFLPAGVYDKEVHMYKFLDGEPEHDVIFVGSKGYHPEWSYRPELIDKLQKRYGDRFTHVGRDGIGIVRGEALNQLYANSKVTVGDTLCIGFDYPYYLSDRIFETTGRGGFIIHPYIKGIEDLFVIGKEIITYDFGNFAELYAKIDYYIEHDDEREAIRKAGFERTKRDHTYLNRWQTIIDEVTK